MKKKVIRLAVVLLVLAAAGAGVWVTLIRDQIESENELVLYGNVDIRQVQLAFNDSERITALLVQEGRPR
ncbi:MAG: hypothetical protein U5R30_05980 [Deltaproteobacteria bacterium]|nr:hypothetical protein [Deltaproteobacteria bacterium]